MPLPQELHEPGYGVEGSENHHNGVRVFAPGALPGIIDALATRRQRQVRIAHCRGQRSRILGPRYAGQARVKRVLDIYNYIARIWSSKVNNFWFSGLTDRRALSASWAEWASSRIIHNSTSLSKYFGFLGSLLTIKSI